MMAPAPRRLNVVELERVSTNKQDLERQEYDLADNRGEFGLNAVRTFRIKESGEKVVTTEDFAELLDELKRPDIDGLNVSAVDRMARPQDMASFAVFQDFITYKKAIFSKREGMIEPWTPRGRKILMGALMQAGNELSDLKDRLQSNRRKMHKQKKPMNTAAPYAIVYVDKYSRDAEGRCQYFKEDERPSSIGTSRREVVVMIFHWRYDLGWRVGTIQTELNRRGILTPGRIGKGGKVEPPGPWSRQTVRQLLMNRHYIGEHWEGGEQIDVECPVFIDREIFEGTQRMFAEAKQMSNGRPATKHLLSGFLRCKICGRRYRTTSGRYPSYVCGNYCYKLHKQICRANSQTRCNKIEDAVWDPIWKLLTDPKLLLANAQAYYDSLPSKSGTAKLEKELATVKARMERTRKMVRLGTEDEDKGNALILEDKQHITEIEADLRAAGSVMTLPPVYVVQAACERIARSSAKLVTFEERRPVLEKLIDLVIWWDNGNAEIEGKVPVAIPSARAQKCNTRVNGYYSSDCSSVVYIPFKLKERVA